MGFVGGEGEAERSSAIRAKEAVEVGGGGGMLTNASKSGACAAETLKQAAFALDPLGVMPDVGHLMPGKALGTEAGAYDRERAGGYDRGREAGGYDSGVIDLTAEAKKGEDGARPLKNRKREEFCCALTGWGGDGLRKKNCEAYEAVYGKGGATARANSTRLLAEPEVRARVEWLEKKVEEAKRHDYMAAQQEIDELRLGLVARGRKNAKLAAVALAAARDFEAAHGLAAKGGGAAVEETATLAVAGDGLNAVRAILAKVTRRG